MKTLTTWNPLREMEEFQNRFQTFFGGFPTFPIRFPKNGERFNTPDWSPLVDIIEDDHEYLFKADLPEMKKDEVRVTIEDRVLYISGERKTENEEKKKKFHRLERFFGREHPLLDLPAGMSMVMGSVAGSSSASQGSDPRGPPHKCSVIFCSRSSSASASTAAAVSSIRRIIRTGVRDDNAARGPCCSSAALTPIEGKRRISENLSAISRAEPSPRPRAATYAADALLRSEAISDQSSASARCRRSGSLLRADRSA